MKKNLLASLLSLSLLFVLGVTLVHAQAGSNTGDIGGSNPGGIENPFRGGDSLIELVKTIINEILMPIGGVIAVLAFIFVGFKFVLAQGKPAEISKARDALLYVAIGTAVLLGAGVIANVIGNTIDQFRT